MSRARATRRIGLLAVGLVVLAAIAGALRFAFVYRARAGFPKRNPPVHTPDLLALDWEAVSIPRRDGPPLPGWWIPAPAASELGAVSDAPAPAAVLVHGWESARDKVLPHALVLNAVGISVLTFDVRGHGDNPAEALPLSVGEYAADTRAALAWLRARPGVGAIGLVGHSMGAAGTLVAAAREPSVAAVVAIAAPAGPSRLTRQTFRLVGLPIPPVIAWPLAWLTTRVYLRPRGHTIGAVSAGRAVREIEAPVLLVHGTDDAIVPVEDVLRLARARRRARPGAVTEVLVVDGGRHSWMYELPPFRAGVARFLARHLGGPLSPAVSAALAESVRAVRPPEAERLAALDAEPGGARSLLGLFRPPKPASTVAAAAAPAKPARAGAAAAAPATQGVAS